MQRDFLKVRLRFKNWDVFQFVDTRVNGVSILRQCKFHDPKRCPEKSDVRYIKKCVFYMYVNVEVSQKLHVCYMYTFLRNWRSTYVQIVRKKKFGKNLCVFFNFINVFYLRYYRGTYVSALLWFID